jgi:hypothetical protein
MSLLKRCGRLFEQEMPRTAVVFSPAIREGRPGEAGKQSGLALASPLGLLLGLKKQLFLAAWAAFLAHSCWLKFCNFIARCTVQNTVQYPSSRLSAFKSSAPAFPFS